MTTKNKYISLAMITILMFFMIILGLNVKSVFAFNGIPNNLTEQELYNETNTYNVSVTTSTTDSDRINNTTQYSVTYNMSQKNSNQVTNAGQRNAEICNDLSLRRKRYGIRKFIDRQRQTRNTQNCVRSVKVRGNNER